MTAPCYIDRSLLPVADQTVAARGGKLWTIFLEASQNGKLALIHQLAAKTLDVARACLLLLVCARTSKGTGRSWDAQQGERHKNLCMGVTSFRLGRLQRPLEGKRLSFHHHCMVVAFRGRRATQQQDKRDRGKREDHHQLEIVDVADDRSLRLYDLIERRASACGPGTQGMTHDAVVERVIECRDVACDGRVIDLIVSCQQIGDHRYSYAGADVARQVVEPGTVGALFGCERRERHDRQWDEQESKSCSLDESGYCDRPLRDV